LKEKKETVELLESIDIGSMGARAHLHSPGNVEECFFVLQKIANSEAFFKV